ncbi:uncharacterized protein LOC114366239 [Ostrinia furnacalis]|uniref:uncharacterized protein LOC114366239 n=1 Tax=Ostrinia furnacalis TaxID=93504 RepID=UPI00103CB9B3|nr:uncharacterized protein LOC114366239 [Ostrinia furnacalis]
MLHLLILIQFLIPFIESIGYDSSGVVVGNLRKRDTIPLHRLSRSDLRRFYGDEDDLHYRKTKDIREDKRFEMTENLIRELKLAENKEALDKLNREVRWLTIDTEEGLGIGL